MKRLLLLCVFLAFAYPCRAQHIDGGGRSVTSVGATVPALMTISGSPVIDAGTLAFGFANQSGNCFLAGSGSV
jgi:hypothetical protein